MFPAIFIDRDGVIIENKTDYVRNWSQVSFLPDSIHALANPKLAEYKIVIVTNQSAVGRGIISLETANSINDRLVHSIRDLGGQIDGVYLCPHSPNDQCECRKPKSGLLLQAAKELSLDLKRSWMIGDAWSDIQAGQAAGVHMAVMVKTGRGVDQLSMQKPTDVTEFLVYDNLVQALKSILADNHPE